MKIINNKQFPFGSYSTINLFGVLFTKSSRLSRTTINHELIHTAQMEELLYIGFYVWYAIEYLSIRLFHKKQNGAYHDVSFEEEAYYNQSNSKYLESRIPYSFLHYLRIKGSK